MPEHEAELLDEQAEAVVGAPFVPKPVVWLGLLALTLVVAGAIIGLGEWGTSRRLPASGSAPQTIMVSTGVQGVQQLFDSGVHGADVLQASSRYAYQKVPHEGEDPTGTVDISDDPVGPTTDSLVSYKAGASPDTYMWVAKRTNVARRVAQVVPTAAWPQVKPQLESLSYEPAEGDSMRRNAEGDVHLVGATLPSYNSEVVLFVNASYFESGSAEELLTKLIESKVDPLLLVVCYDEDDTSVPEQARAEALRFSQMAPGAFK